MSATYLVLKRPFKRPDRADPWLRTRSMPMPMTESIDQVEVITSVQRRRRWWSAGKRRGSSRRLMRRGCRCRWSRDSTGRAEPSVQIAAMPRARCQRSGRRKGGSGLRIPGFAAPDAQIATAFRRTTRYQTGLLQASIELVMVQYFYLPQHCDARRNHRYNHNSCRSYLVLDAAELYLP